MQVLIFVLHYMCHVIGISDTLITRLLATVPMRRGTANGSIHMASIKNRNSQPDNANQRKKIVCEQIKEKSYYDEMS